MEKNLVKSSIIYTFLGFLPLSFAVVFTPFYLNYLSDSEYGTLNLFMLYSGIFALVYHLGVSHAFGFLYWDVYKEKEKLKELISSTLGLLIFFQIIFIPIGLIFGESIVDVIVKSKEEFSYNPVFITALFFSSFLVFYEIFINFFRNEHQLKQFVILSVSTLVLLTLGTVIGVIILEMKVAGAIYGRTIGYGIVVLAFLIYFIKKYGISFNWSKSKYILVFSFPLFFNALVGSLSYGIDRIIIERFDNLENLGIYGFALVVISVIEILFKSLNNAISPTLYKYIQESPIQKRREIKGLSHAIVILLILTITLILATLYPILEILIPENFHRAAYFIPILGFGFIWRVFTTLASYSLYIEKKTKYFIYNQSSNLVITILLGYILYQYFGIMGIVVTMYLVRVIEYLIMNFISNKVRKIDYEFRKLIIISSLLSLSGFAIVYINMNSNSAFKYILYCAPLFIFLLSFPLFLRQEYKNLLLLYRFRKKLF